MLRYVAKSNAFESARTTLTSKADALLSSQHFVLTVYGIGDAFLTQWTEADGVDDDLLRGSTTVQTLFDVLQFYTFVTLTLFAHSIMVSHALTGSQSNDSPTPYV